MGGGLECALACDLRIAEEHAQMALPEASVGLLPCAGGTQNLARLVGEGWAKRMVLLGERVDAATALRIGLVEEVVPKGEGRAKAIAWAKQVEKQSPTSVAASKRLIQATRSQTHVASLVAEREAFVDLFDSQDQSEGERTAANGKRIGIATLNAPKTLNGLSLEMARLLTWRFDAWADDEDIAVVVLQGAGEKAFCAGGDLHGLYRSMRAYREAGESDVRRNGYAAEFFEVEYRLDHRIHTYPKPVLCWGHGIVMGGGIGLMSGASHRVVTERSKLAFPEITVGLYPDVGGSALLGRLPRHGGLFLGLTGALLNASDAIAAKLADWQLGEADRDIVYAELLSTAWQDDDATNAKLLAELLGGRAATPEPGPFRRHAEHIERLCSAGDLDAVVATILADTSDDPWLKTARDTL
ncbi:hypothetical protein KCV01_g23655, partial [Aureobasidium melanogenum]